MQHCAFCQADVITPMYYTTPEIKELHQPYAGLPREVYCRAECSTQRFEALLQQAPAPSAEYN